jgi:hypothetical protein
MMGEAMNQTNKPTTAATESSLGPPTVETNAAGTPNRPRPYRHICATCARWVRPLAAWRWCERWIGRLALARFLVSV